ncbi:ABC transporter ATP-binding protein [Cellulosilyticum lentocellum]|uniref:Xenobiotic-transporting ATPase n=1 Tax=Cellulosilyticum lentocellum (strain ATCC 49066 / DSM 5427 / NCIMB 11756 / RHM5) TaxID=642492 RepID=F2JM19_CELLD|nr:ABC transporter ATP-binding protein [Cellulosilyticum lentocellum]ADZ85799.1 Xenobiotic-transporting ATPase [Cellulosilyticum lentocellum DSM 5427]
MKECIKKSKFLLALTLLLSSLSSISIVYLSVFVQKTIDYVTIGDSNNFRNILIYTISYSITLGLVYFAYDICSKKFIRNVLKMLRSKVFRGIMRANHKDFTNNNTADYISALTNDMKLIEENYIIPLLQILQYTVMFIATVIRLIILSPIVTLALFISMLLLFIVPSIFGKALESKQLEISNSLSIFTCKLKDMFSGYDVIRSFNLKEKIDDEFEENNENIARIKFNADRLFAINESVSQILGLGTQLVAIFLSGYFVLKVELSMGILIAVFQLSGTLVQPVIIIMSNIPKVGSMKAVLERLETFSDYADHGLIGTDEPTFNKSIEVSNLQFSYDEDKNVIKGIDLELKQGKKYAIIGGSGCGKSTLIKLISGYYSNFTGNISYDGKSITNLSIEKVNTMIAMIHQNVYMFDKSIKDNICLFKDFTEANINAALESSGADKFINNIEDGLNYLVGENGCNLSGGQRQRIAIARALIQKTPILILDEGTSAIDMQTAYDIESKLLNIEDLTLINITHKMSEELLGLYNEIIYMENGLIIENGTFKELINKEEKFLDFYSFTKRS